MLTDRDRQILDFEGKRFRHRGARDEAIHRTFGISPTRYAQILNQLIDTRDALEYAPTTVNRLLRLREDRRRLRRTG